MKKTLFLCLAISILFVSFELHQFFQKQQRAAKLAQDIDLIVKKLEKEHPQL